MKKVVLFVAALAISTFAYCEYGSLRSCTINGGHYEGVYQFGSGYRTFTFGTWCPASIRYDFWAGRVCY